MVIKTAAIFILLTQLMVWHIHYLFDSTKPSRKLCDACRMQKRRTTTRTVYIFKWSTIKTASKTYLYMRWYYNNIFYFHFLLPYGGYNIKNHINKSTASLAVENTHIRRGKRSISINRPPPPPPRYNRIKKNVFFWTSLKPISIPATLALI